MWTLPFALTLRIQNLAFHTILQPLSGGITKLSEARVRAFAAVPSVVCAFLVVAMTLIAHFLNFGWRMQLIFAAGFGSVTVWITYLAARAWTLMSEHRQQSVGAGP
eukprot:TRINITY_DN1186_c0_g3_i1.p4 TRINITY_DN1186_c0_g3~~TRINITY_DN1186_c0_g3_i1.p4  ORF type:complete len:106 (-),score=16.55 TRINITY_DN1186_c0_g3_i1:883-1200(-)